MKRLILLLTLTASLSAFAQQNTLLEQSFWQKQPDVNALKAEIAKGNSPTEFNNNLFDATVMAINSQAPYATIEYLLNIPGNGVDKLTHDGRTYIHWAANRGNTDVMELLISKGSKANHKDGHGYTPINFAASGGQQNTKVFDICIANGADLKNDVNGEGANALLLAIPNDKDLKITDYFISKGLDLKSADAAGNNAFAYAAKAGNIDMLKVLQQRGVAPNDNSMLMAAIGTRRGPNSLAFYQYLESIGVKPAVVGKNGETVLHSIVRKPSQHEIIQYFISKGVDVNQADTQGNTALINAAGFNRDTTTVAVLLPHVKDINKANLKGVTALAMATSNNSIEMMRYLVDKGASISFTDSNGDNVGHYLVQSYGTTQGRKPEDFDAKLKYLQSKGFKPGSPSANGNTLYYHAVAKNDLSLVKRLEPLKMDVNIKNKEGLTPLHKAAMISKDDVMLKYLLSIGAKKGIVTEFKETAFDLASENESLTQNKVSVQFLK